MFEADFELAGKQRFTHAATLMLVYRAIDPPDISLASSRKARQQQLSEQSSLATQGIHVELLVGAEKRVLSNRCLPS